MTDEQKLNQIIMKGIQKELELLKVSTEIKAKNDDDLYMHILFNGEAYDYKVSIKRLRNVTYETKGTKH